MQTKALLIFDNSTFSLNPLKKICGYIDLFPLTSNWKDIDSMVSTLKELDVRFGILDTARIINDRVSAYRNNFIEWVSCIGNLKFNSRNLRQWLLLSDKKVSAWWFGLMGDKDTNKNPAFIQIVQLSVILEQIKKNDNATVILALNDRKFLKKIKKNLDTNNIKYRIIKPSSTCSRELLQIIVSYFKGQFLVRVLYTLGKILRRIIHLKKILPPIKVRRNNFDNALLFFSYFPSLVESEAKLGRFRNKFAMPLQDICKLNNKTIVWVLTYEEYQSHSFKDALTFAKRFIEEGEHVFFWQEFINLKSILKSSFDYIRLTFIWRYLRKTIEHKEFDKIIGNDIAGTFLLEAIDQSFYDGYCLNGIIQYEAFKNMFEKISGFSHAVYTCEMMYWEYALNAAKIKSGSIFPVIAYQDFAFSPYLLQMFHSKEELKVKNYSDGIPFPEIVASCGRRPQIMLEKYYNNVVNLETLRFSYLNEFLRSGDSRFGGSKSSNKIILMVCTNIDITESKAIVSLVDAAYNDIKNEVEVWFKGHPALPIERVFKESGITLNGNYYISKTSNISELLPVCDVVLIGEGSTAIEALAFGCEVLVYLNSQILNLSPLLGFDEFYWKIYGPDTLSEVINSIRLGNRTQNIEKKQSFVKEYWNLNPSLDGWKAILNLK